MQAKYLAHHTKKTEEDIMRDFSRPRYFTPFEAQAYGLIDKVAVHVQFCWQMSLCRLPDWDALNVCCRTVSEL